MRKILLIIFIVSFSFSVFGQDPHYSQYYAAPLYLNPAFAGTSEGHRFVINHRNQWPSIPQAFSTFSFSYDYSIPKLRSGFGFLATTDKAGTGGLRSTTLGFLYAYKVQLGKWVLSPAINFAFGTRDLDFNKLVFGDQLFSKGPTNDDAMGKFEDFKFFDFNAGLLFYNETVWLGASIHHLNEPNQSLLGEVSVLPRKRSIHGGVKIPLYRGPFKKDRTSSIAPSFVYRSQGSFDQFDLGLYYLYFPVMAGVWYRGIPVQQSVADNVSHDAVTVIFGLKIQTFEVGYSYDLTISSLGTSAGGAHEISLKYEFITKGHFKRPKPDKFIPCPVFYDKGLKH
ncbi:MAG: PorP/SprF family type IX secretion system membrane protein [Candidatus Cyclobacteriaceae bacterium M3_2C_046]